jgi:hypothetical protein
MANPPKLDPIPQHVSKNPLDRGEPELIAKAGTATSINPPAIPAVSPRRMIGD